MIWKYLRIHFRNDLSKFENLFLVPIGNSSVVKLSRKSAIVSLADSSERGLTLSGELIKLCGSLNVHILKSSEICYHPAIWDDYIQRPNARGLLKSLQRIQEMYGMPSLISRFNETPGNVKEYFRHFIEKWLRQFDKVARPELELLRALPMMSTVDGSGNRESHFVSINDVDLAAPTDGYARIPLPSPQVLIDLSNESSLQLARRLGLEPQRTENILNYIYFPEIHKNNCFTEVLITFMRYVCDNLKHFPAIVSNAARVAFISNKRGVLCKPCELYDIEEDLIAKLFEGEDVFPCGEFAKPQYRDSLFKLGLRRSPMITANEVWNVARKMAQISSFKQSEAMMALLNKYPQLLSETICGTNILKVELSKLRWIKSETERPLQYPEALLLAGEKSVHTLVSPVEVTSSRHVYLVGSVRPTVETRDIALLSQAFDWESDVRLEDVVAHLLNTVSCYSLQQKTAVFFIIQNVYKYLNTKFVHMPIVLEMLKERRWIWHGDGFARTDQMILKDMELDLKPYVFPLPAETTEFRDIWKTCEIKETYNLIDILKNIKHFHEESQRTREEIKRDLHLSVDILNQLSNDTENLELDSIYVPINTMNDTNLVMKELSDCTFCEKEWYENDFQANELGDNVYLIHEHIPLQTAIRFKIPSLVHRTLEAEELGPDVAFGQSESLTRRLHGILEDYNDGLAVLKELIQNADDAGATEIRFLYDERQNLDARKSLINQSMKDFQGPALWCYNNKEFTNEDFNNIVKLGAASKEKSTDKIGRFGLGFNAVYNLTDVPMFMSGQYVVIFDPHTTNLGNAIRDQTKPGIRLNLLNNSNKIEIFADQFKPFNGIFGCNFNSKPRMSSYNGTLFRFPLRTYEQAGKSEVCKTHYDSNKMKELLKCLHDSGRHLMLYTQNIRHISVSHIPDTGSADDIEEWFSFDKDIDRVVRDVGGKADDLDSPKQTAILQRATCVLNDFKEQKLDHIPALESTQVLKITNKNSFISPLRNQASTSVTVWLVVSCLGKNKSFQMAADDETLIPIGGIAAELEQAGETDYKLAKMEPGGLLFCFLPLPISTPFPVHINGYFAIHSSRTHIHEISPLDKVDKKAVWNEALLKDAIAHAYCIFLEDINKLIPKSKSFSAWPTHSDIEEIGFLQCLTRSVYKNICRSQEVRVIQVDNGCVSLNSCIILDSDFRKEEIAEIALMVLKQLVPQSINVIDIPVNIIDTMLQTDEGDIFKKRLLSKHTFYTDFFLPSISKISALERNLLVLHALSSNTLRFHLTNIKCIPVKPDKLFSEAAGEDYISFKPEVLCKPCELYDKEEDVTAKLFEGEDVFPSGDFAQPQYREALLELGLKSSSMISADEVLKVAKKVALISSLEQSEAMVALLNAYPNLLNEPVSGTSSLKTELSELKWVKSDVERPLQYPGSLSLAGEKSVHTLVSPDEVTSSIHVFIVGSVRPTIRTHAISNLSQAFDWESNFRLEDVLAHLMNTVSCYSSLQKPAVLHIVQNVFIYFNRNLVHASSVLNISKGRRWVWHGDGFATDRSNDTEESGPGYDALHVSTTI